jgi:hypothetical protein
MVSPFSGTAVESIVWKEFRDSADRSPSRILPDFSYAGYHHGERAIPDITGPLFNVTDYGAVPDDDVSDEAAIRSAIEAAENAGGGVVYFPAGTYLLWTDKTRIEPLRIRASNIVLRGAGSGLGGTILHFVHHGLVLNSYKVPKLGEEFNQLRYLVQVQVPDAARKAIEHTVIRDAARSSFQLALADTNAFKPGQWVNLSSKGGALSDALLAGQSVPATWERTVRGVAVTELHQIRSIEGGSLALHEPLQTPVSLASQPSVALASMIEEVGIEDVAFRGNWNGRFYHHQTALDDEAWDAVLFQGVANGWIRRCSFLNTNTAVHVKHSAACSFLENRIAGTPGHYCVTVRNGSTWVLQGLSEDSAGQVHGPSVGNLSSGVCVWRWKIKENASFDSHGNMPFATLVDAMEGGTFTRSGGPQSSFPNHLNWLVFWNFNYGGNDAMPVDFWSPALGVAKFVKPWVVGIDGKSVEFVRNHLQENESPGAHVTPESLYEAQLALRLGGLPAWVEESKKEWARVSQTALPIFSSRGHWRTDDKGAIQRDAFRVMGLLEDVQKWFSSFEKTPPVTLSLKGENFELNADWNLLHQLLCNAVSAIGVGANAPAEVEAKIHEHGSLIVIRRMGAVAKSKKANATSEREEALQETRDLARFMGIELQFEDAIGQVSMLVPR